MWRALAISLLLSIGMIGVASAEGAVSAEQVSLVSLITNPAAYDGKRIRVAGYVTTTHFEDCAVYLSRDDFDRQITTNAVKIHWTGCRRAKAGDGWPPPTLVGRFAIAEGRFRRGSDLERNGGYSGLLDDVAKVEPIPSRAQFMKHVVTPWGQEHRLVLLAGIFFVGLVTAGTAWIARAVQSGR